MKIFGNSVKSFKILRNLLKYTLESFKISQNPWKSDQIRGGGGQKFQKLSLRLLKL